MDPHDPILAGLTPPQAEAAMHDGAILVLAGADIRGKWRAVKDESKKTRTDERLKEQKI